MIFLKKYGFRYNKSLQILLLSNSLILLAGAMLAPIYALYVEKIGGDLFDASLTMGIFAISAGTTTIIMGKFADKLKENKLIIIIGYCLMGVSFFLYTLVNSVITLLLVQILVGFSEAFYVPAFDGIYSKHLDKNHEAGEWGIWEALSYFITAIGAIVGGFIVVRYGFNAGFILMSVISFASALYLYLIPSKDL